jgi:DeoR/GlpR family transcriptional regulator of sugar metabolism
MDPHMWQEERHRRIKTLLGALHSVSADRIMNELGVSRETVRRDLLSLESQGELRRTHGGAISLQPVAQAATASTVLPPAAERGDRSARALAKAAAGLLGNGQTLFMDAGTLTLHMADALTAFSDLTVITNSFDAAMRLCGSAQPEQHRNRVLVLGGFVPGPEAATQGDQAISQIHRFKADVALLFPMGVEARQGATHMDLGYAEVARAMASRAAQVVLLADDTKIGTGARVSYCPADRVGTLVTNRKAEASEGYDALAAAVGRVLLV